MKQRVFSGLCSTDVEVISQNYPVKMKIPGIPDENAINGNSGEIINYYGLTKGNIVKEVFRLINEINK
jgi:transketolase